MDAITYTYARNNLTATMDKTIADHEPVIIARQSGDAVVMMSLEDFRSWEETAYLLACRSYLLPLHAGQRRSPRDRRHPQQPGVDPLEPIDPIAWPALVWRDNEHFDFVARLAIEDVEWEPWDPKAPNTGRMLDTAQDLRRP